MIKKETLIIAILFLCVSFGGRAANAMEAGNPESKPSIKSLPVELIEIISRDVIKISENFDEAIKNFKSFSQVLALSKKINLFDKEYKKRDIVDLFSEKFKVPPFIVAKKLRIELLNKTKNELKKLAIYRILKRNNITSDEIDAWYTVNKDRANKVFQEFLANPKANQRETLIAMAAALIYSNAFDSQAINNIPNRFGYTALMFAAMHNYKDIVELLLNTDIDSQAVNIQNKHGKTALMRAENNKEIVELLLKANADLNIQDADGLTALMNAVVLGYEDIVELLLNAGANYDIQDRWGNTALILAPYSVKTIVELLLNAGANPNIKNVNGQTALMKVAEHGHKDIVELLLNAKADPNIQNNGFTALNLATDPEIIALLKSHGAKLIPN